MRPTVTEQLDGLRRILAEAVAPEVTAPYPAEILGGVIGALDALSANWARIPDYLAWEIESTAGVLDAAILLDADLVAEIAAAKAGDDLTDTWPSLEEQQVRMSGLLVQAQPAIAADKDGEAYRLMIAFFRERAYRFPFSMAARPAGKERLIR